ncbi:MAG: hypothetical protein Tsb002_26610 [Wenzhouxiangellaceae bacterium]
MNRLNTVLLIALSGWLSVQNAVADLVSVDDDFVIVGNYDGDTQDILLSMDSNAVTGNFVTCYGLSVTGVAEGTRNTIECNVYDSDGDRVTPLDGIVLSTLDSVSSNGVTYSIDFEHLDVAVSDDNEVFVMWTGDSNNTPTIFVQGFDIDGNTLFDPTEFTNVFAEWDDANLALTPSAFWVVGVFVSVDSVLQSDYSVLASYYDKAGNLTGTVDVFASEVSRLIFDQCITADIASNASGDLVITWIEPVDSAEITCEGSVYAQTYRESGTAISDATQLSDTVEDSDGNDASNFYAPVATAYEDGEYVIAWTDGDSVYTANLLLDGDTASSQEEILSGDVPRIGGNSATQDYVVTSELTSGSSCVIETRLAFDADTTPDVTFSPADCNFDNDVTFAQDGNILLFRVGELANNFGFIYVSRIGLPAEIEVSAVSVQEGDPITGISNVAIIDVSLTRAHPGGEDIQVSYFTRDSTALVGIDYERAEGTLTFSGSSSSLSQQVQIAIIPDTDFEDDEIFEFNLENAINAVLKNGGDEADITILDDDQTPDITADCTDSDASNCREIDEPGASGTSTDIVVTLTMAEAIDSDITVNYSTADGTATAGSDYLATSGVLQFLAGSTQSAFALTILGDDDNNEASTETFTVTLSGGDSISLPDTTLTFSIINELVCSLDLDPDPNEVVVTSDGGSESFTVNSALSTCQWDVTVTDTDGGDTIDWLTITSQTTANIGSGTVEFDIDPYDPATGEPQSRNANIVVTLSDPDDSQFGTSVTFEVGQDGDCDFTLDASSASFTVEGGSGSVEVTASDPSCEWAATSDESWLTVDSPTDPFSGSGTLSYTVSDNAGGTNVENGSRSITLISEEFSYSVNQDGCTYDLDQSSVDVDASDSTATVNVLAPTSATGSCAWTAVSNSSWILIESGSSGSGGGAVTLDILDNASVDSRVGSVTIGDETLTVNQSGQDCDYSVNQSSLTIGPDGDTFEVDVTATDGCSWTLAPQDDWIEVLSNASGIGSETASGAILANLSEIDRSSTLELQATTFGASVATITVNQEGYLIYEPFENGLPGDWVFEPVNFWAVNGTVLVGNLLNLDSGVALDLSTACKDCAAQATMRLNTASNSSLDSATLLVWYEDENNHVGLAMDEFTNAWRLFQVASGNVTMAESSGTSIVPNRSYTVKVTYDGASFFANVDGVDLLTLSKQVGTDPIGFAGFQAQRNIASFDELRVAGTATTLEVILVDSFED